MEPIDPKRSYSNVSIFECIRGICREKSKFGFVMSGNVFAGLLSALITIFRYYVSTDRTYRISWINDKNVSQTIDIGFDNAIEILNKYILSTGVKDIYPKFVKSDSFIWPVRTYNNLYTLLIFDDSFFVQGFISAADALTLDFRDYAVGLPYRITPGGKVIHYEISGYDIGLPREIKLPAPIVSFSHDGYNEDITADETM